MCKIVKIGSGIIWCDEQFIHFMDIKYLQKEDAVLLLEVLKEFLKEEENG